jgi:hypothetical protein
MEAVRIAPNDPDSKQLLEICNRLSANGLDDKIMIVLSRIFIGHGLPTLAAAFAQAPNQKYNLYRQKVEKECPSARGRLAMTTDGALRLNLGAIAGLRDLSPFVGLPLTHLDLKGTSVSDISPLKNMPLQNLSLNATKVTDLSPLKGMRLTKLSLKLSKVSDLSFLKGMPLISLDLAYSPASDLSPLNGMPLTWLACNSTKVTDLSPLKDMPLTCLWAANTQIDDLTPLKGMPLTELTIHNTRISDLSPLKGMPLIRLLFTPKNIRKGIEAIREMKTLTEIGIEIDRDKDCWPASEFWKKYDAGKFNK